MLHPLLNKAMSVLTLYLCSKLALQNNALSKRVMQICALRKQKTVQVYFKIYVDKNILCAIKRALKNFRPQKLTKYIKKC